MIRRVNNLEEVESNKESLKKKKTSKTLIDKVAQSTSLQHLNLEILKIHIIGCLILHLFIIMYFTYKSVTFVFISDIVLLLGPEFKKGQNSPI